MFAVGEAGRHGEAIVVRFDRPGTGELATVVIDAGFQANDKVFVDHIKQYFGTRVDIAVVSHPDADHIGGMPEVIR
jgi:beta-lactamase superfamily II metal-dependent hydrolase